MFVKTSKTGTVSGRTLKPGIIEFEALIAIGNVMLVCPKCDNPVRPVYSVKIMRASEYVKIVVR
jgi:ribosomal protein L24